MNIKKFIGDFSPDDSELKILRKKVRNFKILLKTKIKQKNIDANVFVGGSFAKGTLAKQENYDADIFVRFSQKYEELSDLLEKILKITCLKYKRIHGSRDYFQVVNGNLTFEIIPVIRIKNYRGARNVTDLSYFHVGYIRKNLNDKMKDDIRIAKKFFKAQKIYGAETYVGGFSGYGLECLILSYGGFIKMLKELIKIKAGERVILDPCRHYKNKEDILFSLNESRLNSPIILIDPTWKERNVLAALRRSVFENFQDLAKKFLKKPSARYFVEEKIDISKFKNRKGEFLHLKLFTDRQGGDIAGTKMRKFSDYLFREIGAYFEICDKEFSYNLGQIADVYALLKSKKKYIRMGPPIKMKNAVKKFKQKNKKTYELDGILWVEEPINFDSRKFIEKFILKNEKKIKDMSIEKIIILN